MTFDITITLPDEVAQQAEANGLLSSDALADLIRQEIVRRSGEQLFPLLERLPDTDKGDLTEADVAAEIRAYRAEKRAVREGRR